MNHIYLASPHMSSLEQHYAQDAFATNWIVPLGPHVDAFEQKFAADFGALRTARTATSGWSSPAGVTTP